MNRTRTYRGQRYMLVAVSSNHQPYRPASTFIDNAHTVDMIRHYMDVVNNAVEHVNPGQATVVTLELPLFALAKQIQ